MFGLVRNAVVAAVLAGVVVVALEAPQASATAPSSGKAFSDRLPQGEPASAPARIAIALAGASTQSPAASAKKGDRLSLAQGDACAAQTWPNIGRDCVVAVEGTQLRKAVRTITVETREGANTSVLVRMPAAEIAQR